MAALETNLLINGERVRGQGAALTVENPFTEEPVASVGSASPEQLDAAIAAAREAFRGWERTPAVERAEMLHEVASALRARTDELAELMSSEGGKPRVENADEVGWTAAAFDYYAEIGRDSAGRVIPLDRVDAARAGASRTPSASSAASCPGTTRCCSWPGSSRRRSPPATPRSASRRR